MVLAVLPVRWKSRVSTLLPAVLIASASAALGEEPLPTFHEESEVSLVQVPVVVTDREGQPVRGLAASDFELFDEGARQRIEALDVVDLARFRESGDKPWQLPSAGRRRFLLLFDLTYAGPSSTRKAQNAAARFVSEAMAPEELAGVATVSVDLGARLLATFTADRRQLLAAIRSVGMPAGTDEARDPLGFSLPKTGEAASAVAAPNENDRAPGDGSGPDSFWTQKDISAQNNVDGLATSRVNRHFKSLSGLASALDAVAGKKTIVFFSEGFDERLLAGNVEGTASAADNEAMVRGQFWAINLDRRFASGPLLQGLADTLEQFRRSECAVYPVDIASLRLADTGHLETAHRGRGALDAIAKGSGGHVIQTPDELSRAVERIRDRAVVTYVLSFRPGRTSGESRYHKLKVKVNRSGAKVEARAGYYEPRGFAALSPLQRSLSAADVITHERESSGFSMQMLAVALDSGPASRVPILVEIPGSELLAKAAGPIRLGLYVYAVSESGEVGDFFVRTLRLDPAAESARLRAGPLRYRGQLALPPGRYRVRVLARDEERGLSAFRAASIDVPERETAGVLRASVPLFLSGPPGGITLRDTGGDAASSPDPFVIAGEPFLPFLAPSLTASRPARVCLFLSTAGSAPDVQIQGRIFGEGGGDWAPGRLAVLGRTSPDAAGLWKILLEFEPAAALPPGAYRLAITLRSPAEPGRPAVREAAFRIP